MIEEIIVTCGQMLQVSVEDWDVDVSSQAEIERLYIFILNAQIQLMQVCLALCTHVGISLYMMVFLDREEGICPSPCIKKIQSRPLNRRDRTSHSAMLYVWAKKRGSLSFLGEGLSITSLSS